VIRSEHISKHLIVGAIAVAIVVVGGLMRWLATEKAPSTDLAVPAEAWGATSTQPSFDFSSDEALEISALPAMPIEDDWEISSLPQVEGPAFKPLPLIDRVDEFQIQSLPAIQANEIDSVEVQRDGAEHEDAGQGDFEIRISDFELEDSEHGDAETEEIGGRSDFEAPTLGQLDIKFDNFEFRISSHTKNKLSDLESGISRDLDSHSDDLQIPNLKSGTLKLESPRRNLAQQSSTDTRTDTGFVGTRRLRALPTPDFGFADQQNGLTNGAQDFPVVTASAEIEITGASEFGFKGAAVKPLPQPLADRLAAADTKKKKKKVVAAPKKGEKKVPPKSTSDKDDFKLAAQPKIGDHYVQDKPLTDNCAQLIEPLVSDFSGDALNPYLRYDPGTQMNVYQGKTLNANQRPLVELGRPWYQLGQLSPGSSVLGFHNNVTPQFLIFGDARVGYASNNQNGQSDSLIATQLNLDFDLKLTGTERFHAFISPTGGAQHNRYLLDEDRYVFEGDADIDFGYFEGDLGAMVGGAINKTMPFDLPFTVGIIPLVFQNGIWLEDAFLGFAATLPAKNSPRLDISNMDITFFAGYDKLNSDAFPGDDSAARVMGIATFIEALNGYIEVDYAFLDDRTFDDRSYHNIGIGYTRRYGRFLSNSTRVIVNAGQSTDVVENTADGVLLLSENSLITGEPTNIVPYFNMFAGFDRPQSVARAGVAGGILRNTGILFESDNLTGYPTLDASANDTYGFAAGINILAKEFSQQLVLETAMLGVMGDSGTRKAQGDQFGVGVRYQLPLSNSVIFRADGMMGFLRNDDDVSGVRVEVRKKF